MPVYDLSWLHEEAKVLKYGMLSVEIKVRDGAIHIVTVTQTLKQRSLADVQKKPESLIG